MAAMAVALFVYWGVWHHQYVWDDLLLFVHNADLRWGELTWAAVSRPILESTTYFRPVVLLSFAAEFHWIGVDAGLSHAINLALHLANVLMVYCVACLLFKGAAMSQMRCRALLAALLYAAHPCLVEPTSWAAGRFDLMVTFFCLAALLADLSVRNTVSRAVVVAGLFSLALGSKEHAVVLPILLLINRLAISAPARAEVAPVVWGILKKEWLSILGLGLVFAGYLVLRFSAMERLTHSDYLIGNTLAGSAEHLALALNAAWFYMQQGLFPFISFGVLHPLSWDELRSGAGIAKACGALAFLAISITGILKRQSAAWLLLGYLLALMPVLHLIPLTIGGNIGHDRFMALPLVALVMAVSAVTFPKRMPVRPHVARLLIGLIMGSWMLGAIAQSKVTVPLWASERTLWTWTYQRTPDSSTARTSYLNLLLEDSNYTELNRIMDSVRVDGRLPVLEQIIYAQALIQQGDVVEAEHYLLGVSPPLDLLPYFDDQGKIVKPDGGRTPGWILTIVYWELAKLSANRHDYMQALERIEIANAYKQSVPPNILLHALILLALGETNAGVEKYRMAWALTLEESRPQLLEEKSAFIANFCTQKFPIYNELCYPEWLDEASSVSSPKTSIADDVKWP